MVMRWLLALGLLAILAASLSGCTTQSPVAPAAADHPLLGAQFEGAPEAGAAAGPVAHHGVPQRDESPVTSGIVIGTEVPMAWARQSINISNDFGGADHGNVAVAIAAGKTVVRPGGPDGYRIEAILQARGATEQDARDNLARLVLTHSDSMHADGLHLDTRTETKSATPPLPLPIGQANIGLGWVSVDLTEYLPAAPSYDLSADTASADLMVSGLRGASFTLSTASGDLAASGLNAGNLRAGTASGDLTLEAIRAGRAGFDTSSGSITGTGLHVGILKADSASGDMVLRGTMDSLNADSSSGTIDVDAHGERNGAYNLGSASGSVTLKVLTGQGHAYKVTADTASGSVSVDLRDADQKEKQDHHAEVVSNGFSDAAVQTVVTVDTSSGDITVKG